MPFDQRLWTHAQGLSHAAEVLAVIDDVHGDHLPIPRGEVPHHEFVQVSGHPPGCASGIEDQQDRRRRRDDVDLPVEWLRAEALVVRHHIGEPAAFHHQRPLPDLADAANAGAALLVFRCHFRQLASAGSSVKLRISIPESTSALRTARAISTAPGVSPWTQMLSACVSMRVPS